MSKGQYPFGFGFANERSRNYPSEVTLGLFHFNPQLYLGGYSMFMKKKYIALTVFLPNYLLTAKQFLNYPVSSLSLIENYMFTLI